MSVRFELVVWQGLQNSVIAMLRATNSFGVGGEGVMVGRHAIPSQPTLSAYVMLAGRTLSGRKL